MNPYHVAVIMDGNRRWAKLHNIPSDAGHKKGANVLMNLCKNFKQYNIPYLTVYAFSNENNKRSHEEKIQLFAMLEEYLAGDIQKLHNENIYVNFIGDFTIFNDAIQKKIQKINALKIENPFFTLTIALNYGSKQEIVDAVSQIIKNNLSITQEEITRNLYNASLPNVDLLIRTGDLQRLSNFLLWQTTYAELYFCKCLWPEFNDTEFQKALNFYKQQQRNFGV